MDLESYLNAHHTPKTASRYLREIYLFFSYFEYSNEKKSTQPKAANYQEILEYLGQVRKEKGVQVLKCSLAGIKRYFDYLNATNQRKDHPAKSIRLRDKIHRDIQLQDLFSSSELLQLLERKERYQLLENRNKMILGLLVYQGLTTGEIIRLEVENIDFDKAKIFIKSTSRTNSRTLKLTPKQVLPMYKYVFEDRPKLLKVESNLLVISKSGRVENGEGVSYLVSTFKHLFSDRNLNPRTIRQSVIANLLSSDKDLRWVQVFAGHRYPSSTEQYRQTEVEALKLAILKYHPLG